MLRVSNRGLQGAENGIIGGDLLDFSGNCEPPFTKEHPSVEMVDQKNKLRYNFLLILETKI